MGLLVTALKEESHFSTFFIFDIFCTKSRENAWYFLQPDQVDLNGIENAQENCKPKRIYRRKNDQEPIDQPETEIAIQEKEIAGLTLLEYGQRNSRPSKANKNAQDEPDKQVKELVTGYSLSDKCNILPVNPKYDERLFDELHDFTSNCSEHTQKFKTIWGIII